MVDENYPTNNNDVMPFMHHNGYSTERNVAESAMRCLGADVYDFRLRDKVIFALAPWIQREREAMRDYRKLSDEQNTAYQSDKSKVRRLTDEAWVLARELEGDTYDNKLIRKVASALQDICLALKEMNEPEESP